ncbi:MAG: BON domain-containing protein [Acidobacteriota bacterium]
MKTVGMMLALALSLVAQQPDNTKVNQRDQKSGALTADQQGNSKADVERTAAIRKAILDHKGLSTYGGNVKVITLNGNVTLRGPVRDAAERDLIAGLASGIAGKANVKNDLEIAPKK